MNTTLFATKALSALLLPPLDLLLPCAAGLLLLRRRRRLGLALSALSLLLMAILGTPAGALLLVAPLERQTAPLNSAREAGAQAIVVLGAGRVRNAPEYGGRDVPSTLALARLRYAARLQRETGLPVLVSGGAPDGDAEAEGAVLARSLQEDFSVPVRWVEQASANTRQNAEFSAKLLASQGVRRILLVTDGIHMPRARRLFAATGLEVVPAPVSLVGRPLAATDFLPNGEGAFRAHYALHEWLGIAWAALTSSYREKTAPAVLG